MQRITNFDNLPTMLSPIEVSDVLGVSKGTAYNLFRSEGFPSVRIGKRWVISKKALQEWLEYKEQESREGRK